MKMSSNTDVARLKARSIRSSLGKINDSNAAPQTQSPLFNIPPEIRNMVYMRAFRGSLGQTTCRYCGCQSHDAIAKGLQRTQLVNTALLCTCRIVYFEASRLPLYLTVLHSCSGSVTRLRNRILRFTAKNVLDFNEVRIHGHDLDDLFDRLRVFSRLPQFQPTRLTLDIESSGSLDWGKELRRGLNLQGTLPTSIEMLCLNIRLRNPAIDTWSRDIMTMFPLELDVTDSQRIIQSNAATRTIYNITNAGGPMVQMLVAVIWLHRVPNNIDTDGETSNTDCGHLKVPVHLNDIKRTIQCPRTTSSHVDQ